MKKYTVVWMALIMIVLGLPVQAAEQKELMLLNWSDYMDPEILEEFKQRTSITVKQTYFESVAARDELLVETGGRGFDVALINGDSLRILAKGGWLEPLDDAAIPNLKHINPRWRTIHKETAGYSVPYFWGTLGIAYRLDLIPFTVSSWMDLLQPAEELHGKISMISDSRDMIGIALKALGYSLNSADTQELKEAEMLLRAQAVKTYRYISVDKSSALANGQNELELYYQPLIQTKTGKVVGLEALLRWNDPIEGVISPNRFIPITEDSGLILPIGEWVLREAGRQLSLWHAAGLTDCSVSVNISAIQLQRQDLITIIDQVLKDTGLSHGSWSSKSPKQP